MSNNAKFGHDWKYAIYFDSEADEVEGSRHQITALELIEKLSRLVDVDELIERVTIYKLPLTRWQWTQFLFYHTFVLFQTEKWWWTIEKNSEGITIQRSKNIEAVKDRYRQIERLAGIKEVIEDAGRKSVGDLIRWLYNENELNKKYNYLSCNCKHFAKAVFDHVAKDKIYE